MKKVPDSPHFAKEAEQSLVAALFSDTGVEVFDRVALIVKADDFYFDHHRIVFKAFSDLMDREIKPDAVTLATHLKSSSGYDANVAQALAEAYSAPYALDNIEAYAQSIAEKADARRLSAKLSGLQERMALVGGELTSQDLLREIEAVSMSFEKQQNDNQLLQTPLEALTKVVETLDARSMGQSIGEPTGLSNLDEKLGGMVAGDLIIIAGRPSMGKTVLGLNVAGAHATKHPQSTPEKDRALTVVFSLEMQTEKLLFRYLSNFGSINHDRLRAAKLDDRDWSSLTAAIAKYQDADIRIDCNPFLTPAIMRGKLRTLVKKTGRRLGMVVVDYLQLMDADDVGPGANRNTEITQISRMLKRMAKEFNCPVIALSQLNRSVEQRADKRPMMSDLRESGAIEQDADVILMLYRDEYYNPDTTYKGMAEIIIGKARDAQVGMVPVRFRGEYQRFENMDYGTVSYDSKYGDDE